MNNFNEAEFIANTNAQARKFQALQSFYRLKALLIPSFLERNKRSLNSLEAELMREYDSKEKKCFNCGSPNVGKTGLGDYACYDCGIYSKDNKKPY